MTIPGVLALLAAVASAVVGLIVFLANPRKPVNIIFGAFCVLLTLYALLEAGFYQALSLQAAESFVPFLNCWVVLPAVLVHFALVYTGRTARPGKGWVYPAIYAPTAIFVALVFTTDRLAAEVISGPWGFWASSSAWPCWCSCRARSRTQCSR